MRKCHKSGVRATRNPAAAHPIQVAADFCVSCVCQSFCFQSVYIKCAVKKRMRYMASISITLHSVIEKLKLYQGSINFHSSGTRTDIFNLEYRYLVQALHLVDYKYLMHTEMFNICIRVFSLQRSLQISNLQSSSSLVDLNSKLLRLQVFQYF